MGLNEDILLHNGNCRNTTPNIVLSWKKLTLWTLNKEKKSWMRSLTTRIQYEKQIILNNFDGQVKNGAFVAILGPSGAGKTSFLAALAGRSSLKSSGQVLLNSRPWSDLALRLSCLVPQHYMVTECLTVSEHIYFMSEMKLNNNMTKADKRLILDRIIQQLRFRNKLDTTIVHLSGGEKKALALATALLSGPRLIFCDEPTSGLDSYSASLVVELLRGQVAAGRIVICSIHQPSSEIYYAFNTVILIAEASLVFQGSLMECMRFFEASNLQCPTSFNPAEYYLIILSQAADNGDDQASILADKYRSILQEKDSMYEHEENDLTAVNLCRENSKPPWLKQVRLIMWRSAVEAKRSYWLHFIQLSINLVIETFNEIYDLLSVASFAFNLLGIFSWVLYSMFTHAVGCRCLLATAAFMLCVAFWGLTGNTQEGIQNMHGFWWFVSSEVAFSIAYATLNAFNTDLLIFKRERDVYCCSAYYVARFLCLVPRCVVWPLLFLFIATFGLALPMPAVIYWEMALALIITSLASASYGLMLSALFASSGIEMDIAAPIDLVLFLVSGVFVRIATLPAWLAWIRFVSHFFYAVEAVYAIYWTKVDFIECPATNMSTCLTSGQQVLADYGFYIRYWFDAAGLLAIVVLWCVVGYLGLKREGRSSEY